jgi:uncharacterized protein YutE (UPF0331/DUF86 family)
MSAEADYIKAERENILHTVAMIESLLSKHNLSEYEVIALGKLLQDIYSGIERILRSRLENKGIKVEKTESWHKDLLVTSREESVISEEYFEAFKKLLLFRHMQIHGYGYMLDKQMLLDLAGVVPSVCREFLEGIIE